MAAPLRTTYLRLMWLKSQNLSTIGTKKRCFNIFSAVHQKGNSSDDSKSAELDLDELFSPSSHTQDRLGSSPSTSYLRAKRTGSQSVTVKQKQKVNLESVPDGRGAPKSKSIDIRSVPSFKQILLEKHREACRSVIIRTYNPEVTINSLSTHGHIHHAQFACPEKSYLLVEFRNEGSVKRLQTNAEYFNDPNQFPLMSRQLIDISKQGPRNPKSTLEIYQGNWHEKSSNYYPVMNSLDDELEYLCIRKCLNADDVRLRFFVCVLVEDLLQSFLPGSRVIPYGSCLNGFGWWNGDLDMMLCFQGDPFSNKLPRMSQARQPLRYLSEVFGSERHLAQRTLAMVASLLQLMPRVQNVFKILNARVPIIRFKQMAVNLQCDLSIQAMDSIKMTELLYLYSVSDPRVKPLMAGIKQWAICHNQTAGGEQQKPTTIGLLTLLLFYLQTRSPPVVPTLKQIQESAKPSEMFTIDDVTYGLPTKPSLLRRSANTESAESLLHGFFTFYSEFDFANKAISLIEGQTYDKPADSTPVHVENPLCIGLNICRNINNAHLKSFVTAMKEAAQKLENLADGNGADRSNLSSLFSDQPPESKLSVLFSSTQGGDEQSVIEFSDLFASEKSANQADNNNDVLTDNGGHDHDIKATDLRNDLDSDDIKKSSETNSVKESVQSSSAMGISTIHRTQEEVTVIVDNVENVNCEGDVSKKRVKNRLEKDGSTAVKKS